MKNLEEILSRVREAGIKALRKAQKAIEDLKSEGLIKIYREGEIEEEDYNVSGVDGSYRSMTAFVKPLSIIKVAVARFRDDEYSLLGGIEEGEGHTFVRVYYEDDYVVEGDSLRMLRLEALAANREIGEGADYVFIDGPFMNPPPDIYIDHKLFRDNLNERARIIRSNAIAFVKRARKNLITSRYDYLANASESILLIKMLSLLRRDNPTGAIVIGPFKEYIKGLETTLYRRYVSRSLLHKPVVIEVPEGVYRKKEGFPERILSDKYRVNDYRANIPNVLRLAHEVARITEGEARNVFSIVYKALRGLESEFYERCGRLRTKPRRHVRRQDRTH